jgi:phosphatidylglycerol:prolipoprotein diacylglycerol transferase
MSNTRRRRSGHPGSGAITPGSPKSFVVTGQTVNLAPQQGRGETTRLQAFVERAAPEVLGVSVLFQSPPSPSLDAITLRIIGRRLTVGGRPSRSDTFTYHETITDLVSGCGPMTVTAKIHGVPPGEWIVRTEMLTSGSKSGLLADGPHRLARPLAHARWSWRHWRPAGAAPEPIRTRLAPWVRTPGVLIGSWPALVLLGIVLALTAQRIIIRSRGFDYGDVLTVSMVSLLAGGVAAKVWFMVLNRKARRRDGWAVQGMVAGIAISAPALLLLLRIPVGGFLDATAPALMIGLGVGRLGCFLTGCCAGRATASRWGIWSSNRRVGARRVPT